MGKILDTITVFFKGNTDDLKKKKKEAEDLSAEAAKNIQATTTATNATNTALDTTNKYLATTETITYSIGKDIASWGEAAKESSEQINQALSSEKVKREEERRTKALTATKKGANEVEKALKGVVSQFAAATIGGLTIAGAVNETKQFVGTVTDLAHASRNFDIPIEKLYGYRQAVKDSGGDVRDFIGTLENLRSTYHRTGIELQKIHDDTAKQIIQVGKVDPGSARAIGANGGFTQGEIDYLLSNPKALENIDAQTSAVGKTKDKVLELTSAWGRLTNEIGDNTVGAINKIVPIIDPILDRVTEFIKNGRLHGAERRAALGRFFSGAVDIVSNALDKSANNISTGDLFSTQRGTSYPLHTQTLPLGYLNYNHDLIGDAGRSDNRSVSISIDEVNINSPEQVNAEILMREIQNVVHVSAADHIISYYNDPRIA